MSAPAAVVTPSLPSAASLLPLATSILRNHHDAEDAVQDALVKMLVAGTGRRGDVEYPTASRRCWERRVTRNVVLDHYRQQFKMLQRREVQDDAFRGDDSGRYGVTVSHEAATGDRETLERIFSAASPEELDVLRLRADGYTYEEIASLLGVGSQTPKVRVFRLRKRLERQGFKR